MEKKDILQNLNHVHHLCTGKKFIDVKESIHYLVKISEYIYDNKMTLLNEFEQMITKKVSQITTIQESKNILEEIKLKIERIIGLTIIKSKYK